MKEQYLDKNGLEIVVQEIMKTINNNGSIVTLQQLSDLPLIGKINTQYIIKELNEVYRWDEDEIKYYCVGTNYENIEIIRGGTSKE